MVRHNNFFHTRPHDKNAPTSISHMSHFKQNWGIFGVMYISGPAPSLAKQLAKFPEMKERWRFFATIGCTTYNDAFVHKASNGEYNTKFCVQRAKEWVKKDWLRVSCTPKSTRRGKYVHTKKTTQQKGDIVTKKIRNRHCIFTFPRTSGKTIQEIADMFSSFTKLGFFDEDEASHQYPVFVQLKGRSHFTFRFRKTM